LINYCKYRKNQMKEAIENENKLETLDLDDFENFVASL
jgi:hypothetical protein